MTNAIMIAWLATIGADRVDLLAGRGPFLLTPFLVLTPFMVASQLVRAIGRRESTVLPAGAARYSLVVTAFVAVSLISLFASVEILAGARRFSLLTFQIYATLAGVLFLCNSEDRNKILVRAAYLGIAIALLFNIVQVWLWLTGKTAETIPEGQIFFLAPWMYGPWVPRLSGPAIDMNRGGFLFLVYVFLLIRLARPSRWRRAFIAVAVLGILATLSRSAIMALVVMAALLFLQAGRRLKMPRVTLLGIVGGVGAIALAMILFPRSFQAVVDFAGPPLVLRVMGDGSSSIHFALFGYGMELGTSSLKNALMGVGFGNSFAVLEEFFPGDKYGNFHSLYLTYWVETGIVGLFLGVLLLLYPFMKSGAYRPLIGAIMMFNVFYQSSMEPLFWFIAAAAWVGLAAGRSRRAGRSPVASGVARRVGHPGLLARAGGTAAFLLTLGGCSELLPPSYEYSKIEVEAKRLNGEPVEGVDVTLYTWNRDLAYGETGAEGRHVFPFVPFGNYAVAAGPPSGYRFPGPSARFAYVDGLTATEGSDTTVSFLLLKEGLGSVYVRVVDLQGNPIAGAGLELYTFNGAVGRGGTDAAGEHTFTNVSAGEYGVRVFAPPTYGAEIPFKAGLYVEADHEARVSFDLDRCEGVAVVAVQSVDGNPIPGLTVTLYTATSFESEGVTDATGTHEFALKCGIEYGVRVDLPAGLSISEGGRSYVDGLRVAAGEEIGVGFNVTMCYGDIEVRVTDSAGNPVESASLRLYTHNANIAQSVTGSSGSSTFSGLPCGQYGVEMTPPAGYKTPSGDPSSIIAGLDVTAGGHLVVSFVVERS